MKRNVSAVLAALTLVSACDKPLDRTLQPELGAPGTLKIPAAVETVLPNGLRLAVIQQSRLPVLDAVLVLKHGSEMDPLGKDGLASLTASLIREGTTTRTSPDISEQQDFLGIGLGARSGLEQTIVQVHTPTAVLDSALALMADIILNPVFAEAEFNRVKGETLTSLAQLQDRPPAIANRAFASLVYGSAHPYGRPVAGLESTVKSIARDDAVKFWESFYRPNAATLIITGDISPEEARTKIESLFGNWESRDIPPAHIVSIPSSQATSIALIDRPGSPQSSFRIGSVGVPRSTKDYYALTVLNTLLGGSFTSRLNMNLRETKGYTYGASSSFSMRREAGPFLASAEIVSEKSDSALHEFMKELNAIREPISAEEVDKAKQYLILGFAGRFETSSDLASQLASLVMYDLPLDTWNNYQAEIKKITPEDVHSAAQTYINPDRLRIVVVGDRSNIEEPLRKIGIPLAIHDINGRLIQ